jgi:anti-anti-sigma factor
MSDVIETVVHEHALVVTILRSRLDDASSRELLEEVLAEAAFKPSVPVVLDMTRVRFAPSVALSAILKLSKSFKLDGRRIALCGVHQRVVDTMRVARLHTVLEVYDTLEQALQAASPSE